MNQNNRFFYGIPANNEPVYGLYEPIYDLFFVVHTKLDTVKEIVRLFSSRFTLHICKISDAKNYNIGILDNSICHLWSLSNKSDFPITRFADPNRIIIPELLVQKNSELPWNFDQDQKYIMAACQWIEEYILVLNLKKSKFEEYMATEFMTLDITNTVNSMPNAPFVEKYTQAITEIKNIIYFEFDLETASNKIEKIFKDTNA